MPSIPTGARRGKKRTIYESDISSDDPSSTRNTKRIRNASSSFDLEDFLKSEQSERRGFQERILETIQEWNRELKRNAEANQAFQNNFLALMGNLVQRQN